MKLIVLTVVMLMALGLDLNIATANSADGNLVFEGTVSKIGQPVPQSDDMTQYRLAKYRIERVCQGQYVNYPH